MTPAPADAQPDWNGMARAMQKFGAVGTEEAIESTLRSFAHPPAAPAQDVGEVITKAQLERLRLRGSSSIVGGDIRAALDELTRLRAALDAANARADAMATAVAELRNIRDAVPSKWDESQRDQFQQWAQNRARYTLAAIDAASKP